MMQCRVCARSEATSFNATKKNRFTILSIGGGSSSNEIARQQDTFYPLTCGDTYCHACLADYARASLHAHQLLPLRCCQRRVPLEWIEEVLEKPEAGYYRFLVDKTTIKSQSQAPDVDDELSGVHPTRTPKKTAPCAGCDLSWSPLFVLQCGHSFCAECLAELCRVDVDNGELPSCCSIPISTNAMVEAQVLQTASAAKSVLTSSSMIVIDDDEQQVGSGGDQQAPPPPPPAAASAQPAQQKQQRRQSKRLLFGKAKKKTNTPAKEANEVNLVDSTEPIRNQQGQDNGEDIVHVDDLDEVVELPRPFCTVCKKLVLTTEASCGHAFCFKCIGDRCCQAVKNDKDGGIGIPLRCCGELLALELVRPTISTHVFTHYKKVMAKSEDDLKQLVKRKRGAGGKQKAKSTASIETPPPLPAKRLRLTGSLVTVPVTLDEAFRSTSETTTTTSECVACMDEIVVDASQFKCPCGHVYCADCLTLMAKKSLDDRALVPIRCCGKELPVEYVGRVLPRRSLATYNRFVKEKDWRSSNLQSDREYAKLVKRIDGKQCPKCGIGVQKITGCNAMSCSHGHRFCWGCGSEKCMCHYANGY